VGGIVHGIVWYYLPPLSPSLAVFKGMTDNEIFEGSNR
jgi:hypothetical protein